MEVERQVAADRGLVLLPRTQTGNGQVFPPEGVVRDEDHATRGAMVQGPPDEALEKAQDPNIMREKFMQQGMKLREM